VARPAEVLITDAPAEPPTYVLPGGVRIYGLGPPPPPRPRLPQPSMFAALLNALVPEAFLVEVGDRWGRDGLPIRVVHAETKARGWAIMRRPANLHHDHVDAAMEALDTALERLRGDWSSDVSPLS
jgi:hypothetical protein